MSCEYWMLTHCVGDIHSFRVDVVAWYMAGLLSQCMTIMPVIKGRHAAKEEEKSADDSTSAYILVLVLCNKLVWSHDVV